MKNGQPEAKVWTLIHRNHKTVNRLYCKTMIAIILPLYLSPIMKYLIKAKPNSARNRTMHDFHMTMYFSVSSLISSEE